MAGTVSSAGNTNYYTTTITGDGVNSSFTITHSLGIRNKLVQVYLQSTNELVEVDVVLTSVDSTTFTFAVIPANAIVYNVNLLGFN
jgi:hypothetical protein